MNKVLRKGLVFDKVAYLGKEFVDGKIDRDTYIKGLMGVSSWLMINVYLSGMTTALILVWLF
jgi:hypothetical protein